MKLTCTQENFKKAIYNTERVVGKQITLPILENILLETEGGMLKVSATNLEIGVSLKIGAKIEKEGKITIPAKLIGNFTANLPGNDTIELEVVESVLKISSGEYKAQIKGMGAQEFPIIPDMEGEFLFTLPLQKSKEFIGKLMPATAIDNTRPELTGINVLFFENEVHLAATDSFRLAEAIIPIKKTKPEEYDLLISKNNSAIIPAQTVAEILRIADEETDEIQVAMEENQIFFQIGVVKIVSRLINGKYPEYKHIIPQKFETEARIEREDLNRAVKVAGIFTNSKSGEISLHINSKEKKITIQSQAEEIGENIAHVLADVTGPEQKIAFNPRYILDGINSVTSLRLSLMANDGSSPVLIKMIDDKSKKPLKEFTYVVMPIKN